MQHELVFIFSLSVIFIFLQTRFSHNLPPSTFIYNMTQVTIEHILQAAERIEVHRTPVLTNTTINELASQEIAPIELFFKCELFQKTGCKEYIKMTFT